MAKIVECVPNISEGRRKDVIEACVDQIRQTPGVTLLDYSSDESHNRSVITFMGSPEGVEEAAVKLAKNLGYINVSGLGATDFYAVTIQYYVREFFAIGLEIVRGNF